MANAIQTIPNAYLASQIISMSPVLQRASLAKSLQVLVGTTVSLGSTYEPLTYNATGLFDAASSSLSAAFNQLSPTLVSTAATDSATDEASAKLAAALEAATLAENSTALDQALAKSVAEQILINALAIADDANSGSAGSSSEIGTLTEIAQQSVATNSAETLGELLSDNISQPGTATAAIATEETVSNTDNATMLPSPAPTPESLAIESGMETITTPTTTTNAVPPSAATTDSQNVISEVVYPPASNITPDSVMQAVATVAQNPAYANLVASQYVGMAASMAQSPSVITPPIRLDEIKPVIAIPAITTLSNLGAQSGRDGNPASGYRQRKTSSMAYLKSS